MIFAIRSHHVVVAKPEIDTPTRLRGRSVVISQPSGTVHRQLLKFLEPYILDPKDVNLLNLGETPHRALALFFFNVTAATVIYTLSLHDALPISSMRRAT